MSRRGQFRNLGNASALAGGIVDASTGPVQQITLDQATTALSIRNLIDGEIIILNLVQDATGGRLVTFGGAGGMTILNPPTLTDGPNRTTSVAIVGTNAQGGNLGAVISVVVNGMSPNAYVSDANDYATVANDGTTPNGVSLDALAGDAVRIRIAGGDQVVYTAATQVWGATLGINVGAAFNWNYVAGTTVSFSINSVSRITLDNNGLAFFAKAPVAKPTVAGVRTGTLAELQAVVLSLLTALRDSGAGLGLIVDTTT